MTAAGTLARPPTGPSDGRPARTAGRAVGVVVGVVALVAGVVWLLTRLSGGAAPVDTTVDRATDPNGLRALVLLLEHFDAEVLVGPPSMLGAEDVDVVLRVPGVELAPAAEDRLWDWVADGGVLVDAGTVASGDEPVGGAAARADRTVDLRRGSGCDLGGIPDVERLVVAATDRALPTDGARACFGVDDRSGAYVVGAPEGTGTAIRLGGASPFTNRLLDQADNAVLATSLLAPRPGTRVLLVAGRNGLPMGRGATDGLGGGGGAGGGASPDEPAPSQDGDGDGEDQAADEDGLLDLIPTGVRWALLQVALAFLLYAWWRGRRVGDPVSEPLPVAIAGSELVAAVGGLLARTGSPDRAARLLRQDVSRSLAGRLGLPADAPPEAVAAAVAPHSSMPSEQVQALLTDAPVADAHALRGLAARLDALREEVLHGAHP